MTTVQGDGLGHPIKLSRDDHLVITHLKRVISLSSSPHRLFHHLVLSAMAPPT
jgi:hypothetical protein